jgi:hypothetical protein
MVSAIALSRSREHADRPGRADAWLGLIVGTVFAVSWLLLTLWYIRYLLIRG